MTLEQQLALEALAGRTLSSGEIDQITPLILPAVRNDAAIAEILSVGRTKIESRAIGIGTILATLGSTGGTFLDGLVTMGITDRNVYWAMELVKAGNLDIGMQATRDQVSAIALAVPDIAPAINALLALAVVPDPIATMAVSTTLNGVI